MHAHWHLILAAAALLALAAFVIAALLAKGSRWSCAAKPLLSPAEQIVFGQLRSAFPEYVVLSQVSLSQAVTIAARGKNRQILFNKVSAKSLDFVLCDSKFNLVIAIELDDRSHDKASARERDEVKNRVLESAKIPLLRWRAGKVPAFIDMHRLIEDAVMRTKETRH